jgi:hypothetical protein
MSLPTLKVKTNQPTESEELELVVRVFQTLERWKKEKESKGTDSNQKTVARLAVCR